MNVISYGLFLFTLEGDPQKPIKCDLPVDGPFALGAGREGYLITKPNGGTYVVDATTSLIIGRNVEQVRTEINNVTPEFVECRLEALKAILAAPVPLKPDDFWSKLSF